MSWSIRGSSRKLALSAVLVAGMALLLTARRRGEVWHTLADQN